MENFNKFLTKFELEFIMKDLKINYKIWIEKDGQNILGKGGARLLDLIDKFKDLGKAAKHMPCSYKYAWTIIKKIKDRYNESPVITHKGGTGGGGGIELSSFGKRLLRKYKQFQEFIQDSLEYPEFWQYYGLKIKSKNEIIGQIIKIEKDNSVCKLKVQLDIGQKFNSIITTESVDELNLIPDKNVMIIIKATEIQVDNGEML